MPPRLARSSVQTAAPKNARKKNKKRNLDAYAIASHSAPAKKQIKQHRLGELLDDRPAPKRRRDSEDDDVAALDDEDLRGAQAKRRKATFDDGDGDIEEGSDSEGNEWTLGGLGSGDEDSDLDSEEAFGSSDEEKFEGFTFRGSKGGEPKKGKMKSRRESDERGRQGGVNLDEEDEGMDEDGDEEDDFGDEGVDLATMLDDDGEDGQVDGDDGESEDDEEESASESESDGDEDDGMNDEERNARMRDRLEALDGDQQAEKPRQKSSQNSLSVDDLLADLDPSAKKRFAAATKTKKKSERPTTLAAPLPKRQQDRLNREVASQKAKEQLDRWRDTVIQNRRAEFLSFPLKDPDQGEPRGKDKFVDSKPQNELEANIQRIMEESGMGPKEGQGAAEDGEDALMKAEGMEEKKMDVEEVMRRRAELRKTRELLFNEERKAKRIAKIKSKSYRRVHRKEKARQAEQQREERQMLGLEPMDEDENEKQDRRRAEERMSTKHRDSKWAKQLKQTNRAAWDEGARDSVNEEARRQEELRRRVEGQEIGSGDSDRSIHDGDDDNDDSDAVTLRQLDHMKSDGDDAERKGLAGMKFMRDADARRKAQNDEDIERMRKDMAIEDGDEAESGDEIDDQGLGRAIFGPPGRRGRDEKPKKEKKPEMEEGSDSEGEEGNGGDDDAEIVAERQQESSAASKKAKETRSGPFSQSNGIGAKQKNATPALVDDTNDTPSWFSNAKKSKKARRTEDDFDSAIQRPEAESPAASKNVQKQPSPKDNQTDTTANQTNGWTVVKYSNHGDSDSDSDVDETSSNPTLTRAQQNSALQRQAFAGDDVAAAFRAEKAAQEASEDEQETSTHLPGWGSWTGTGLSKSVRKANARQKHNPLFKHKTPGGVKKADRQDAKLPDVIVSEKGERKGRKYLAGMLPHGFEKREEYERSLRRPIGGEWGTKEVVQRNTRPRVVVKKGAIVGAMERPMV